MILARRPLIDTHHTIRIFRQLPFLVGCMPSSLTGCFSPYSLEKAVPACDFAMTNTLVEQLLINTARAYHHQPIHFTGISNIAATFDF